MGREPALKAGGLPSRLGSSFGREGVPKPASPSPADGCDEMLTVTEVAGPGARTARRHLTQLRRDACPPRGRHAAPSAAAGRRAAVARRAPDAEAARRFSCPPGTLVALPPKLAGRRRPRTRHSGRGQPGFPVGEARGRPRRRGDLGFGEGEVGSWLRTGRDVQVVGPCPARGRMPTPRPAVPRRPGSCQRRLGHSSEHALSHSEVSPRGGPIIMLSPEQRENEMRNKSVFRERSQSKKKKQKRRHIQ